LLAQAELFFGRHVIRDPELFKVEADLIVANRVIFEFADGINKILPSDLFDAS